MAFSDIKKSILDEAHKQAEECRLQGLKEVERIKSSWEEKAKERKKELLEASKKKAEQEFLQAEFQVQNKIQSQVLRKKQEILDQVYNSVLDRLSQLDEGQYIELMEELIKSLPQESAYLVSASGKSKWLKKALEKSCCNHKLSSEEIKSRGGFIFQSDQLEIDCTFEALLEKTKRETLSVVAEKIFNS